MKSHSLFHGTKRRLLLATSVALAALILFSLTVLATKGRLYAAHNIKNERAGSSVSAAGPVAGART